MDYVLAVGFSLFGEVSPEMRRAAAGEMIVAARMRKTDRQLVVLRPYSLWEAHLKVSLDELDDPQPFSTEDGFKTTPLPPLPCWDRSVPRQDWLRGFGPDPSAE